MDAQKQTQQSLTLYCLQCQGKFPSGTSVCPVDGGALTTVLPDPLLGTTFAEKYEILAVVGRGGMSTVYKARHTLMDSLVAIKILNSALVTDHSHMERFTQEAKALNALRHHNIVQVFDFGIFENAKPYLITEFLEGDSLADLLQITTIIPVERAMHIFLQMCDGLAQAHKKGIVHRDLKTGNIVIVQEPDERDVVKILDFGIAKMIGSDDKDSQRLTREGEVFGSPLYMSPEQCTGGVVDARSDIYSLGCVMYEVLTGGPPHIGANTLETLNKHVSEPALSLRGIAPDLVIPELVDAVVMKALSKNPFARQQTVEELKKALLDAAKRSRLYVESQQAKATYEPNAFETGAKGGIADVAEDDELALARKQNEEKKNMQSLVLDAISLTEKQEQERKRLKRYVFGLYGLLAVGLAMFGFLLMWQGPSEDRGTLFNKLLWQFNLAAGDNALKKKDYTDAEEHFTSAATISKQFGDQGDRFIKSELALLRVYEDSNNTAKMPKVKMAIFEADAKRMSEAAAYEGKQKNVRAAFHTSLDLDDLDANSALKYSQHFVQLAKAYLAKGKISQAHKAIERAIAIEEMHGSENSKSVVDCSNQILAECNEAEHKRESQTLLSRAVIANRKAGH